MSIRSFFKVRKSKEFEYKPRIWDADKEDREERLRLIKEELGVVINTSDNTQYVPNIKGRFKKEYDRNSKVSKPKQGYGSKVRRLILIVTVVFVGLILFYLLQLYPYLFTGEKQKQSPENRIELYE